MPTARGRTRAPRPKGRATAPARKPGARRRASIVLPKAVREIANMNPRAFWSCYNTVPPPLKTSFGNYSTLNLVKRQIIATSTTQDVIVMVPNLSQSCIAGFRFTDTGANTPVLQNVYGPLTSGFPQAIRPLRMSVELKNLTTAVNVAGTVLSLSYDNALDVDMVYNAAPLAGLNISAASVSSLKSLVESAPETRTYTGTELLMGHTFVSCPAAWPEYNHYYDFLAPAFSGDNTQMASIDMFNISEGQEGVTYPGAVTAQVNKGFGDVPGMRGFLLVFKATPNAQSYEITFRRQDGARYPANTLGHMFHRPARGGDERSEIQMINSARAVTQDPSAGFPTQALVQALVPEAASAIGTAVRAGASRLISSTPNVFSAESAFAPQLASLGKFGPLMAFA